jgi:hypothetical protein
MADLTVAQLSAGGGSGVTVTPVAGTVSTGDTFINDGYSLVVLYGGSGLSGGYDVNFKAKKAMDSGFDSDLVVKCGATATSNLSIVYGVKPRNYNDASNRARLVVANAAVKISPIRTHSNVGFVSGESWVQNVIPSTSLAGGATPVFAPNDETTFIIVEGKTTNAGTIRIRGTAPDRDSGRIGEISIAVPADNSIYVSGHFPVEQWGSAIEISNTGAGSTSFKFVAFSAKQGAIVASS